MLVHTMGRQRQTPPATVGREELGVWARSASANPTPAQILSGKSNPQLKLRGKGSLGEGIGRPAGPDNRDFPGLLGAEVDRDFQGRAGRKGLVPPEGVVLEKGL